MEREKRTIGAFRVRLMDILGILITTGLILYIINYITGWLLKFKTITMQRRVHHIIFFLLIANVILILFNADFLSNKFLFFTFSLLCLLMIPLNLNADRYHITFSTLGLVIYVFTMLNYQFFSYFD